MREFLKSAQRKKIANMGQKSRTDMHKTTPFFVDRLA